MYINNLDERGLENPGRTTDRSKSLIDYRRQSIDPGSEESKNLECLKFGTEL